MQEEYVLAVFDAIRRHANIRAAAVTGSRALSVVTFVPDRDAGSARDRVWLFDMVGKGSHVLYQLA